MPAVAPRPTVVTQPTPMFNRIKSLVGKWEFHAEKGSVIRVSYRLVSRGSVLVQSFFTASGYETMTVFHVDGANLMATHYCAQGNQPRLRLDAASMPDHLTFVFFDATSLASPTASHLVKLELIFTGPDEYTETETYEEDGKPDVTRLHFHRQP